MSRMHIFYALQYIRSICNTTFLLMEVCLNDMLFFLHISLNNRINEMLCKATILYFAAQISSMFVKNLLVIFMIFMTL